MPQTDLKNCRTFLRIDREQGAATNLSLYFKPGIKLPSPLTTHETFLHYFQGAATAYGILIGRTWMLPASTEHKALRRRKDGFHPPQSYSMSGVKSWVS